MTNDTNPNPIFLFRDFSKNFGAVFGVASNEDKYKSLFLVLDSTVLYTDMPEDLANQGIIHPIMHFACKAAFDVLSQQGIDYVVPDNVVPDECRKHWYFDDDGALNHINPDEDGLWICLTGVTPEDIENAFTQNFCVA